MTTVTTTYTYDILNHLTGVSMPCGSNTQTRTFNYTSGSTVGIDLLSATNPENGTVTYIYNSDHTLNTKTDAKGQHFTYSYDGYKRVTGISVGGVGLRTFIYDTNTLDGSFSGSSTKGRLVAVQNAQFNAPGTGAVTALQFTEMYGYTVAGLVNGKRLQVNETLTGGTVKTLNLDAAYTYDVEGKITSLNYPTTYAWNGSALVGTSGPTYTYSFDAMDRATGLKDQNNSTAVSGVQYNAANQYLGINYYGASETRTYNSMNQMTRLTIPGSLDISYNFSATANDGKITGQTDNISGETVTYQYDSLKRLIAASGSGWSESYGYDAFGNLVSKTPTGGAPTLSIAVNPGTNQVVGQSYDANGNQTSVPGQAGVTYDAEDRLLIAPGIQYAYDSTNKRVWRGYVGNGNLVSQEVYLYGLGGQKLGTYAVTANAGTTPYLADSTTNLAVFFRSKRVGITTNGTTTAFIQNRLGSQGNYYPYGEARGTVVYDAVGFATYTLDSTLLNYADQRYYFNNFGRFMTPDPFAGSGGPLSPMSWNRYSYTRGDPVNGFDPRGLDPQPGQDCVPGDEGCDPRPKSDSEGGTEGGGGGDPGNGGADGSGFTTGDFLRDSNGNLVLDAQGNPIVGDPTTTNVENVSVVNGQYTIADAWSVNMGLYLPPWISDYPIHGPAGLPTPCSGGGFFFVGDKLPGVPVEAYGLVDYESGNGWSVGGLVEAHLGPVSGGGEYLHHFGKNKKSDPGSPGGGIVFLNGKGKSVKLGQLSVGLLGDTHGNVGGYAGVGIAGVGGYVNFNGCPGN